MSNEFIQAADEARRLLRGFKSFDEVAQALELTGNVVQARAEAEAALEALKPQIETAKTELAEIKAQAKAAKAKSADAVEASERQADRVLASAQGKADDLMAAAAQAMAKAKADAADLAMAGAAALAKAIEARDAVAAETTALQAKLDTLKAQATALLGV
jgi:colicin import membrane protein